MSPTVLGLQTMLDKCVSFGKNHLIKFNSTKTEFAISGPSFHHDTPFVYVDLRQVHPQDSLTHLGFHLLINKSKHVVSFDESHLTYRMSETIGAFNTHTIHTHQCWRSFLSSRHNIHAL